MQSIEGDQSRNQFAQFTMEAADGVKLDQDIKRLAQLIKSLHKEIPSEMNLLVKKESSEREQTGYQNVRILNRAEQESRIAEVTKQLQDLEDEDSDEYEQDTDEDFGKLASYVNQGIQTNASQNQQRRANLLSHAKQGKYASKGIILEAMLQSASKDSSP